MKKRFIIGFLCIFILTSCSINRLAINAVSNALTGAGSAEVFTGDSDLQLVADALPFAIKMYEALLSQNPNHQGLLLTTGSLFIMYANAFVHSPADMLDPVFDYEERLNAIERAKQLYLRGNEILLSALDKKYPGFAAASVQDGSLGPFLARARADDVPLLYWTAAGSFLAYSLDLFDFELGSNIPDWSAMMERAYQLDPDFNNGAIDSFYILYYGSLPELMGGDRARAELYFQRALEKSSYLSAGVFVAYVRAVAIPEQDYNSFRENLERALAIDVDLDPANRLLNVLSQRQARFLLDHEWDYFSVIPGW